MNKRLSIIALFVLLIFSPNYIMGQAAVSSMSSSALRAGIALKHTEIRVEELVNFHRHEISLPEWNQRVGFDTRSGKMADGKFAFQIGLATHRNLVAEHRPPLNLVLVIDRSGSMSGDRIQNVKKSLLKLVGKLTSKDLISIVTYSDEASVCVETTQADKIESIESAIRNIRAGGSTNLHAGLMKGYEIAKRNLDGARSSRVILLTDGLANRGVIDESEIASQSKTFNDQGIGLSTIGLGDSFNRSLLRELADAGRGAIHFVADASDIQKTFVDEFDGLLSPTASDVAVTIRVPKGKQLPKIFGYEPQKKKHGYRIPLENLSYGATQVIIGKIPKGDPGQVVVELSYFDVCTSKQVVVEKTIEFSKKGNPSPSLKKNYTIAKVANSIRQSAKLSESGKNEKALKRLATALSFAKSNFGNFETESDVDVKRVCEIADRQRSRLAVVCDGENLER